MFRCLVDSLTRPRFIAEHVNMKTIKFIGYFFLLVLISTIPNIVVYSFNPGISEQVASLLVSDLQSVETSYHYSVVDNKLVDTTGTNSLKVVEVSGLNALINEKSQANSLIKTYVFFNPGNESIDIPNEKNPYVAINLGSEKLEISIETPTPNESGKQEMSGEIISLSYTYSELGVNNIDFSEIKSYSTYGITLKIEKIIDKIVKPYLPVVYLIGIPSIFIANASSIAMEILVLAVVVFFFFRMGNLKFMEIIKLITLSMTPSAVASIFLILPVGTIGYYTIYIIGQILTISYFYRALRQLYLNKMMK